MKIISIILLLALSVAAQPFTVNDPAMLNRKAAVAPPPPCNQFDSFTAGGLGDSTESIGLSAGTYYVGMYYAPQTNETVCKMSFKLTSINNGGHISAKTLVAKIYLLSGANFSTLIGTSDNVTGSDSWSGTSVDFPFSTTAAITTGNTYGVAVTMNGCCYGTGEYVLMNQGGFGTSPGAYYGNLTWNSSGVNTGGGTYMLGFNFFGQ